MERKIYAPWAFQENEQEKAKINQDIYRGIAGKYKQFWRDEPTEDELKKLMCYRSAGTGYGHIKYRILSNPQKFSVLEQALICDGGNLCFGYRLEGELIVIHTD